jgi:Spy/CpxP family protein refolding chaperone
VLNLSDDQTAKVRVLLERRQPRVIEVWVDARTALRAQVDSALADFTTVLTPEQQDRLVRLLRARGVEVTAP